MGDLDLISACASQRETLKMEQHWRGRNIKMLWALILLGIAYSGILHYQRTLTGMDELDGIKVVNWLGFSLKAVKGIVPGHHQKVLDPDAVQGVEDGFHLVAVFVLAGEVDDRIQPHVADLPAEYVGEKGRVASSIIGYGEGVDQFSSDRLLRKDHRLLDNFTLCSPSGYQLKGVDKILCLQGFFKLVRFHGSVLSASLLAEAE